VIGVRWFASNSCFGFAPLSLLPINLFPPLWGKVLPLFRHLLRSFAPAAVLPCCSWFWFWRVVSAASLGLFCTLLHLLSSECRGSLVVLCSCIPVIVLLLHRAVLV